MRKRTGLAVVLLLCLSLWGCQKTGEMPETEANQRPDGTVFMMTATDLHYLSPKLTDYGEAFTKMMARGDGKMSDYASQLTDAFLWKVTAEKPDVLILSGDLAFNGEKQSHVDLAEKLAAVRAQGIPVAVLPGNHDVQYPFSFRYEGSDIYRTANVSPEEFTEIYQDMGYAQALSRDEHSLSYVFPVSEDVRLLMLDVNAVEKQGNVPEETLSWVEQQLAQAERDGVTVIGVSYQNLMVHNDLFIRGYRIGIYNRVLELFAKYGVNLNLSGHIHIQHIARDTDYCEAATGSLAVYPHLYGVVDITKQGDSAYRAEETDVTGWAKANGVETPELLDFKTLSAKRFEDSNSGKVLEELEYVDVTDSQRKAMGELVVTMNRLYFSGHLWEEKERIREQEAWKLLEAQGEELFLNEYLNSLMDGGTSPANELLIPGKKEQ